MPLAVLADAELVAITYLRSVAEVSAIVGTRVFWEIPNAPTWPLLRVTRIGGTASVPRRLDAARLQLEAWASTKGAATTLARTAQAAMWEARGTHAGAVISGVDDSLGLQWIPDDSSSPPRPRVLWSQILYLHPAN